MGRRGPREGPGRPGQERGGGGTGTRPGLWDGVTSDLLSKHSRPARLQTPPRVCHWVPGSGRHRALPAAWTSLPTHRDGRPDVAANAPVSPSQKPRTQLPWLLRPSGWRLGEVKRLPQSHTTTRQESWAQGHCCLTQGLPPRGPQALRRPPLRLPSFPHGCSSRQPPAGSED